MPSLDGTSGEEESELQRKTVLTGRPWEAQAGFSRATRLGNVVEVSMTSPSGPDGKILHAGDVYEQTKCALAIIGDALAELGATFGDVARTRMYLTDMSRWDEAGRAHAEVFSAILPATGWIGVAGFFHPDIAVEVDAVAYLDG